MGKTHTIQTSKYDEKRFEHTCDFCDTDMAVVETVYRQIHEGHRNASIVKVEVARCMYCGVMPAVRVGGKQEVPEFC